MTQDDVVTLRDRIRELESALGQSGSSTITNTFRIPRQRAQLLGLLMAVPQVTTEMVEQKLRVANHAKVVVNRLRDDLKRYSGEAGIAPLEIQSQRSLGWWLDKPTKDRIKQLLHMAPGQPQEAVKEDSFDLDLVGGE